MINDETAVSGLPCNSSVELRSAVSLPCVDFSAECSVTNRTKWSLDSACTGHILGNSKCLVDKRKEAILHHIRSPLLCLHACKELFLVCSVLLRDEEGTRKSLLPLELVGLGNIDLGNSSSGLHAGEMRLPPHAVSAPFAMDLRDRSRPARAVQQHLGFHSNQASSLYSVLLLLPSTQTCTETRAVQAHAAGAGEKWLPLKAGHLPPPQCKARRFHSRNSRSFRAFPPTQL